MENLFLILFIVLASLVLFSLIVVPIILGIVIGKKIYRNQLVRKSKEDWTRTCSAPDDYEQHLMWDSGIKWAEENKAYVKEVDIVSQGYHLYGEYYDFGYDRAVIIVPGRTETLCYSYYYAPSYQRAKCNILLIDKRGHGLSDGKYEDGGQHSYVDLLAWSKLLHDDFHMNDITYHGICIGSSLCAFALASKDCPSYVKRFINDGMYETFYITFKNHMKKENRPIFPFCYTALANALFTCKTNFFTNGPKYLMDKIQVPTLFIYTDKDEFSTPDQGERMYQNCAAKEKELYFFHKGRHSHVRFHNEEEYDQVVASWLDNHPAQNL